MKEHDAVICSLLRLETWSSAVAFNLPTFFFNQKDNIVINFLIFKNSSSLWYFYMHLKQGPYNQTTLFTLCLLCESEFCISCYYWEFLVLPSFPSPSRMLELQEALTSCPARLLPLQQRRTQAQGGQGTWWMDTMMWWTQWMWGWILAQSSLHTEPLSLAGNMPFLLTPLPTF